MKFQKPKGTRDFYPEEMNARQKVFAKMKSVAKRYGFNEIETPAFENLSLLTAKGGEEISSQIFTLEQRGSEKFGLRFDLSVPVTRMFTEKQREITKPVKWFYLTRMWRYEAPQKGRLREFYQYGVELFGSNSAKADAEVISIAIDTLKELGLTKQDFKVKINNRKLLQGLIEGLKITKIEPVIRIVDKKAKITEEEFEKELTDIGLNKEQIDGMKNILKIKDFSEINKANITEQAKEGLKELKEAYKYLDKDFVEIDLTIARGLAYYTGTVFEGRAGNLRSIFGGGRYNKMVEQFGGEPEPATGFAMGDVVLEILLKERNLWPKETKEVDYYVVIFDEVIEKGIEIVNKLRKKNSVEIDLMGRSIRKQLDYANKIKAKKVIFIGEEEIMAESVKIKDMETGEEKMTPIKELTLK